MLYLMKAFTRLSTVVFLSVLLAACSTVQTRIKQSPDTFHALSVSDQDLILHGKIRQGMSKNAVWLAWGRADSISHGSAGGHDFETWAYLTYESQPVCGYGMQPLFWDRQFFCPPVYETGYVTTAYPFKKVTFEKQRVIAWAASDLR